MEGEHEGSRSQCEREKEYRERNFGRVGEERRGDKTKIGENDRTRENGRFQER